MKNHLLYLLLSLIGIWPTIGQVAQNPENSSIFEEKEVGKKNNSILTFTLEDVTAPNGTILCVPVKADNFTEIFFVQTGFSFDPTILRYIELQDGDLSDVQVNAFSALQGILHILWFFDLDGVTLEEGSILFEICFEVIGDTGQISPLDLTSFPTFPLEVGGENGLVELLVNNGQLTVGTPQEDINIVPTLTQWATMTLGLIMLIFGVLAINQEVIIRAPLT